MADLPEGAAWISFDGQELHRGGGEGRPLMVDARCLEGESVEGAYAHVCALADDDARLPYDQPEVQQVRRDALAWWIPLLGDSLVCLTTLALDEAGYAGAITVTRDPEQLGYDPFARIFPPTLVRTDLFCSVAPPPGPVLERYAGVAWPGGTFAGK
ncbi:MAG: hypothetical protein ACR2LH_01410 [Thermoleophilaceae bacterium]